jgi:hypothetical protein
MNKLALLIQQCDSEIRAGRVREVRKRLTGLNLARAPRESRLPLATLCRRVGLYAQGLVLLRRLVRSERGAPTATAHERAEYAVLLLRSGAVPEALGMLKQIDPTEAHEALLYRAFGHFLQWEFREAIPILDRYLDHPLEPYATLIGRTNLAYAYAYSSWEKEYFEPALKLARENIEITKAQGHTQLEKSGRAILAQIHIQGNDLESASKELVVARGGAPLENTNDHFLVTKWSLILEALQSMSSKPLERLRIAAARNHEWDALREADFYSLKIDFQPELYLHLYFGSPFDDFRRRCSEELGCREHPASYIFGTQDSTLLDLNTGEVEGFDLSPGRQAHQLFEVLLRDLYQPLSVSGVFGALFPGEYFDVGSSPGRIHQIVRRARRWIDKTGASLKVEEEDGFYSLMLTGDFSFRIPLERFAINSPRAHFERLKISFPPEVSFSAREVQQELGLPRATIYRLMNHWIEAGMLHWHGDTHRTSFYGFAAAPDLSLKTAA